MHACKCSVQCGVVGGIQEGACPCMHAVWCDWWDGKEQSCGEQCIDGIDMVVVDDSPKASPTLQATV